MNGAKNIKGFIVPAVIASAVIVCTVFAGGLNWQDCILPTAALAAVGIGRIKRTAPEESISLIALALLTAVSAIKTQGDFQTGLYEAEKLFVFIAAYFIGVSYKNRRFFCGVLMHTAAAVAVIGIFAYCRIIRLDEFIFNDGGLIRLQSLFKYANTAACFLGCGYFAFLKMYEEKESRVLSCMGMCILTALYLTFSKACIPLFLIIGTILIYNRKELRGIFVFQNAVSGFFALLMLIAVKRHLYFLVLLLASLSTASGALRLKDKLKGRLYFLWLIFMGICAVGGTGLIIFRPEMFSTFYKRINYSVDALELLKVNPLFGCGVGSWRTLQYGIQKTAYSVSYLHNGILQLFVENGILFALLFLAMTVRSAYCAVKNGAYELFCMILLIMLHSIFDFDLSFGAILLIFGLVSGMAASKTEEGQSIAKSRAYNVTKLAAGGAVIAMLAAVSLYAVCEYTLRASFENKYIDKKYDEAYAAAERLEKICPGDSQLQITLAALEEKTGNDRGEILRRLEKAVSMSPHDPEIYKSYMSYAAEEGNIRELCRKYIELCPKHETTYAYVKSFAEKAYKKGTISKEKQDEVLKMADEYRKKENVIDRNELLRKLVNEK